MVCRAPEPVGNGTKALGLEYSAFRIHPDKLMHNEITIYLEPIQDHTGKYHSGSNMGSSLGCFQDLFFERASQETFSENYLGKLSGQLLGNYIGSNSK